MFMLFYHLNTPNINIIQCLYPSWISTWFGNATDDGGDANDYGGNATDDGDATDGDAVT